MLHQTMNCGHQILFAAHPIVHGNAALNALAAMLLLMGWRLAKRGRIKTHTRVMLAAFAVSTAFLACYVWYHWHEGSVRFEHEGAVRHLYLAILATHVLLAIAVPPLAIWQIFLGFQATKQCPEPDGQSSQRAAAYRRRHIHLARWTFPIWLYVSATGVVVYVMLYHLWPPGGR